MIKILSIALLVLWTFSNIAEARGGGHHFGAAHKTSTAHHSLNYSVRHLFGG
jgi:hypothetical protein